MFSRTNIISENTQVIADHPGLKPDILVNSIGRSPVVLEAEYLPAHTAEEEARARLGLEVASNGRMIEAAIALRYPEQLKKATDLPTDLRSSTLSYAVFTQEPDKGIKRFPESGWLDGSVEDLADLIRLVSVPQWAVDQATEILRKGIDNAASILDEVAELRGETVKDIAARLGMTDVTQTRRMACAIMANAMVFHERIAKMHAGINTLQKVCGDHVSNPQQEVLAAWDAILKINYWPIFAIARDILGELQSGDASRILRRLRETAQEINSAGVENAHDLTGRIFQTLIADRKYLATFYTLPASAALLARLAVAKMEGVDWSSKEAIGKLRIADFACGTGTLLSAVYEQIAARHERTGGNPADLHSIMMEEVLYGCDVMPSAVHITGSTLSGVEPAEKFGRSRLYPMSYGRQKDGKVNIGSLELLRADNVMTSYNTSDPEQRIGSTGEELVEQIRAELPHGGYDLVIMNPPFTSNTAKEAGNLGKFAPAFAAFDATNNDQKDMAKRMASLKKDSCYHGHAGMASAFAELAERKLKPGGILALVLPLSASAASSWQAFRRMLSRRYADITIFSIAASSNDNLSFSSDTGMAECLVIARKNISTEVMEEPLCFASVSHGPPGLAHASALATAIIESHEIRRVEDGPYGGTPLMTGDELIGEVITIPHAANGEIWGAVRIADYSLAQTAFALSRSQLWLPALPPPLQLKTAPLQDLATLGLYDLDIVGSPPQGPFDKVPYRHAATYPSLWNHDAKNETHLVCKPDSRLRVRSGMEEKAATVWETASRPHLSRDFRFNSQPIGVATTNVVTIGGRAWPNVRFLDPRFDLVFSLWANATLGLLSFWWHANRQQSGRGSMSINAARSLPTLDVRTLTDAQLAKAEEIFNEFRDKDLLPAYLADADPIRALLDRRVICDLLGFDEEIYHGVRRLAAKWCAEPSVHGGKKRPKDAQFAT